jgi:AmmeMemoRadiSam system protein B
LASVDFSHYLTNFEAKEKNIESLRAIEKRSYDELFSFGNDHMDSPASVALVLKTMDAINANKMTVLHDTNSGEMLGDNFSQITSYLSLSFSAKK